MMSRIGSDPKGFTLIEAMFTVIILSIGLIGILRAYSVSLDALDIGQQSIEATFLLKEKMSEIEGRAIEEGGLSAGISQEQFKDEFSNYEWELDVKPGSNDKLNEVLLIVYRKQHPRRYTLATYVDAKK